MQCLLIKSAVWTLQAVFQILAAYQIQARQHQHSQVLTAGQLRLTTTIQYKIVPMSSNLVKGWRTNYVLDQTYDNKHNHRFGNNQFVHR